ncbi:MAG: sporulation transcriptional regulator SpoIIID [Oscillospiraceae bacterium]|nr:sporulation transcriptional regulator SpoIIID [Oscillospiraceae bacterium]
MNRLVEERAVELGNYIIKTKTTVRNAAKIFGISKSTVHKDVSERLKNINSKLYSDVKVILKINKSQRHIRGGLATKNKYAMAKSKNSSS